MNRNLSIEEEMRFELKATFHRSLVDSRVQGGIALYLRSHKKPLGTHLSWHLSWEPKTPGKGD